MNAPLTRRNLVRAAGATLGAAVLPVGIGALAAEMPPLGLPVASPPVFDPAAFLDDLRACGCRPYAFRRIDPGGVLGPWDYGIAPPAGRGFGPGYSTVMARWSDAIDACPDHGARVVDFILDQQARKAA